MSEKPENPAVEVTQADRKAAAELWLQQTIAGHGVYQTWMNTVVQAFKKGKHDGDAITQALARHRLLAQRTKDTAP